VVAVSQGDPPQVREDAPPEEPKDFTELLAAFKALQETVLAEVQKAAAAAAKSGERPALRLSGWDRFNQFTNSGLFFMIVGAAFLIAAALTMNAQHAAFTFVLVVVGVAVLLFGTGTQGVGESQAPGYKVAIAGGAGVIAFCVGWGIVKYADDIKTVFQIEKKYVRVTLEGLEGAEYMANYTASVTLNGIGIPVARHPDSIELFIPYTANDWIEGARVVDDVFVESNQNSFARCRVGNKDAQTQPAKKADEHKGDAFIVKTIRTAIFPVADNRDLRPRFTEYLTIRLRKSVVLAGSSGLDFPVYTDRVCVTLLHQDKMKALQRRSVESADTSNRPTKQDQAPPSDGPAPILPPDV
jgi:hypothetical protein